ncbi:hypothetical protein [Variovorax brevis]|uniref:hypothetical protein n=1 Tax=Variovorax brevis TaxID=3053503 RepID=UPI00257901D6|nr:hypothetical protein [Variovorax sp. J22R133]
MSLLKENFQQGQFHHRSTADCVEDIGRNAVVQRLGADDFQSIIRIEDSRACRVDTPNGLPHRKLFRGLFESPDVWHRFLHPDGTTGNQVLSIELSCEVISTLFKERTVAVSEVDVHLIFKNRIHNAVYRAGAGLISVKASHRAGTVTASAPASNFTSIEALTAGTPIASFPLAFDIKPGVVSTLALELPETAIAGIAAPLIEPIPGSTHVRLATVAIEDLWVIVKYTLK